MKSYRVAAKYLSTGDRLINGLVIKKVNHRQDANFVWVTLENESQIRFTRHQMVEMGGL